MSVKTATQNARFYYGGNEISRERAEELEVLNNTLLNTAIETKNFSLMLGCKFITIIDKPSKIKLFEN